MEPTMEGLQDMFRQRKLEKLVNDLGDDLTSFEQFKNRTLETWKEYYKLAGADIYTYLHPNSDSWTFGKLLACQLPDLEKSKSSTTSETGTVPTYPRECGVNFGKWESFDSDVNTFVSSEQITDLLSKVVDFKPNYDLEYCGNELEVQIRIYYNICKPLQGLMNDLGMPVSFSFPSGDNGVVFEPDLVCKAYDKEKNTTLTAVIEVKPWWSFEMFQDPSAQYNEDIKSDDTDSKLVKGIQQIYGYMSYDYLRYGILSTYKSTYFLKRIKESILLISEPKKISDPDYLKCWLFVCSESCKEGLYSSPTGDPFSTTGKEIAPIINNDKYGLTPINALQIQLADIVERKYSGISKGALGIVISGSIRNQENLKLKMVDTFNTPDALTSCLKEVDLYKKLQGLQGLIIPKFYGFFNLHGFLVLALEDCGTPITKAEFAQHKDTIDKAVRLIKDNGVVHGDLECRDGIHPNILRQGNEIRIIDFHVAEDISNPKKRKI